MALNVTFTGNVYDSTGAAYTGGEVRYQGLYYGASSGNPSKWNTERVTSFGQFNINFGDGDWLSQDGSVNVGDKAVILFWTPNTSVRSDLNLIEWCMIEIEHTGPYIYVQNVQTKGPMSPNCSFTVTGSDRVNENVYLNDVGCNDDNSWEYSSKTHWHRYQLYSQDIFTVNSLPDNAIYIDWDDSNTETNNVGSSYSHQYTFPNDYDIFARCTNRNALTCSDTITTRIYWHQPSVDFAATNWAPDPQGFNGLGLNVVFTNQTSNPDLRMIVDGWFWDWTLPDTGDYGDYSTSYNAVEYVFSPNHEWRNPGSHQVGLVCHWWDGFNWQENSTSKSVLQKIWNVSGGLSWTTPVLVNENVYFTSGIGGNVDYIYDVDYNIDSIPTYLDLRYEESFVHVFRVSQIHNVTQIINYNDGFSTRVKTGDFEIFMSPQASFVQEVYGCGYRFKSTSTAGAPPIINYEWKVDEGGGRVATLKGAEHSSLYYSWPRIGTYQIELRVTDSINLGGSTTKTYDVTSCPSIGTSGTTPTPTPSPTGTIPPSARGGGGDAGLIYREKFPIVRVFSKPEDEDDDWFKVRLKSVVEESKKYK